MLYIQGDVKMGSFFHLAPLKDFGSFASRMRVRQFDFSHCTIAASLLSVPSHAHMVLWLLKSPIIIWTSCF